MCVTDFKTEQSAIIAAIKPSKNIIDNKEYNLVVCTTKQKMRISYRMAVTIF
jgi:hypothetical protein